MSNSTNIINITSVWVPQLAGPVSAFIENASDHWPVYYSIQPTGVPPAPADEGHRLAPREVQLTNPIVDGNSLYIRHSRTIEGKDQKVVLTDADLSGHMGWLDYNDAATAITPITITGGGGEFVLTNDGLGPFTKKSFAPAGVTDIWDVDTDLFDWSQLSLGDTIDIRLDFEVIIASVNTELYVDLHLGVGGTEIVIPFITQRNFKETGTYQQTRYSGIYMGAANVLDNGANFRVTADKTCTVVVNGWYCRIHRQSG